MAIIRSVAGDTPVLDWILGVEQKPTPATAVEAPNVAQRADTASRKPIHRAPGACVVCGRPLDQGTGQVPRRKHEECKQFGAFLAAAARALGQIEFATDERRARVRAQVIRVANQVPARWQRPRGAGGRFVSLKTRTAGVAAPAVADPKEGRSELAEPHRTSERARGTTR